MSPTHWPSASDYSLAIQNPKNCFVPAELKKGKPKLNKLGIPIPASGQFAVVFKFENKKESYAIRCFIRPVTNQKDRYVELSQYFKDLSLPSIVDFEYMQNGIRIKGINRPIVIMDWAPGTLLSKYIETHLKQSSQILELAKKWRLLVAQLSGLNAAHGDLQHGNIIISPKGIIKLVDYDGFFIPPIGKKPPGESGHPNYQHPERIDKGYYSKSADSFSALVIYTSLIVLANEPDLWSYYNGENLIFLAEDFSNPRKTSIWNKLIKNSDPKVRYLTDALINSCKMSVTKIPTLEEILIDLPATTHLKQSSRSKSVPTKAIKSTQYTAKDWLPQYVQTKQKSSNKSISTSAPSASQQISAVGIGKKSSANLLKCKKCGALNNSSRDFCISKKCEQFLHGHQICAYCGEKAKPILADGSVGFCTECGQ